VKGTVFGGMIREPLISFRKATGQKPLRIIFYRDGGWAAIQTQEGLFKLRLKVLENWMTPDVKNKIKRMDNTNITLHLSKPFVAVRVACRAYDRTPGSRSFP
jgi:hypothetical protein